MNSRCAVEQKNGNGSARLWSGFQTCIELLR